MDSDITNERERRASTRFPLQLLVDYGARPTSDVGTTVNISSGGVLFTARDELAVGTQLELNLAWPVLLGGSTALQLRMWGRIVRASGHQAALRVARSEFRTTQQQRNPDPWPGATLEHLPLTSRERETVQLVTQGYKNKEIAENMSLSVQTVKNHLHSAFQKLGTSDRVELALYAIYKALG